jgi:type III restriction enzyme
VAHLHQLLQDRVTEWRAAGYPHENYPAIAEVLGFQRDDAGSLRFLRAPQLRALETYWYLRLVAGTPHVFELYRSLFPKKAELIRALGIPKQAFEEADYELDPLLESAPTTSSFVPTGSSRCARRSRWSTPATSSPWRWARGRRS